MIRRRFRPCLFSAAPNSVPARPLERLESRVFLSAAQPHFADFSTTTGLVANGFGSDAVTSGNTLQLTNLSNHEARSVWWSKAVPIDTFTTRFSFGTSNSVQSADGLTFTIQNGSTSAVGADGANLGYTGISKSVALAFNIYNLSAYGSNFGFASGGTIPPTNTDMTPADLHNGDTYNATVTYNGSILAITVTDASDSSKTFSASEAINIPQTIGGNKAIVGFTAATGAENSPQSIASWTYRGSNAPFVVTPAAATPASVDGTKTHLTITGGDTNGESNLTYTWSLVKAPAGAKPPKFTANGTNGAKSINAKFFKAGRYVFRCTIKNKLGLSTTSDVTVIVHQTATAMRLIPHIRVVHNGDHVNFQGAIVDQFGHALPEQPTIRYSIEEGTGTINARSGHYVASNDNGHLVIAATGGGFVGTVGGTLEN